MPEILDDIAYLSQEIGPRPAGTEEEQQAALYISDQFKKRVGIRAQIEDFSCNSNAEIVNVILCVLPVVLSILAMIRNIFVIPTILVAVLCAVLFALEIANRPLLSKAFQRGVSQNVVAKYRPEGLRGKRSRKVIVVANYDSGKVQNELKLGNMLGILQKASALALLLLPVIWIIRAIFALGATGTSLIVWNVITVIVMVLALLPIALFIMHNRAQFNEGANSNASGVAALLELADRINNTPTDFEFDADIHGEEAAREAGLIPEGADIEYEAEPAAEPELTEEERLMAAKAAVAALTGKPLREYAPAPAAPRPDMQREAEYGYAGESDAGMDEEAYDQVVPEEGADSGPDAFATAATQGSSVELAYEQPAVETVGTPIPDWYRKAQEKADKSHWDEKPVRRSRYASALDEAVASSSAFFDAANRATGEEDAFIEEKFGNVITEVPAPMPAEFADDQGKDVDVAYVEQQPAYAYDDVQQEVAPEIAPEPAREEQPLAADFMIEQPSEDPFEKEDNTAPIPPIPDPMIESVVSDDEFIPGSTRAMAPIDVSELRASLKEDSLQAARDLQARPSRNVEPAQRRDVDRVVYEDEMEDIDYFEDQPAAPHAQMELPELESSLPPISELHKQRAPLAGSSNPSLSSQIPRINLDAFGVNTTGNAEPLDNKRAALRNMLPSMSGSITVEPDLQPQKSAVSMTGSFAPIASTGSVGRVGDELVEGLDPEELYVDDADDSFSETTMTETGAYAGPGYMEMPESRASRFFGRFRKKNNTREDRRSAQEWLDVEDDFNPTEVGAARGGWESFDNDDQGRESSNRRRNDSFDDEWNGGAFSKVRSMIPGSGDKEYDQEFDQEFDQGYDQEYADDQPEFEDYAPVGESYDIDGELDQIESFYAKKMEVEVWFVALGSELAGNCGMKAFLAEHSADLRGSVVINLDSLGAGTFTYIDREGYILDKSPSTRIRRYIKKAQQGSGVSITDGIIRWRDSAASVAMTRGIQGVTLAGMDGSKPALMGQGDDVLENIDVNVLYDRVDFIETLVRNV